MKKVKSINITKLTEKYGPGYIAKDKKTGKVVAHASRVDVLMNKIKAGKKEKETVISWVPKHGVQYCLKHLKQLYLSELGETNFLSTYP